MTCWSRSYELRQLEDCPHPNPLPEGEGTDRGMLQKYIDVKVLGRIHNRLGLSGRRTSSDTPVGPLPESGGTDCGMLQKYIDLKVLGRIHNRLGLSGRRTSSDTPVGPLPESGGTDCEMLQKYIDLKVLLRIHNRLGLSGRCTTPDSSVGPLSRRERAGVRGRALMPCAKTSTNKKGPAFAGPFSWGGL